jgi:hypothetical protein
MLVMMRESVETRRVNEREESLKSSPQTRFTEAIQLAA